MVISEDPVENILQGNFQIIEQTAPEPSHNCCPFLLSCCRRLSIRVDCVHISGQVENVERDGGHVTAEVSGSEEDPYLVELDFSEDGEVEDWSCDCPYDWGPVCKHTVAVLLAIRRKTY